MNETKNTPEPAHDCAEIIARKMYAIEKYSRTHPEIYRNWDDLTEDDKSARKAAVQALPGILMTHAGDDIKAWLAARIGTSSPWRRVLSHLSAAGVGAVVLWATSLLSSCSTSMTPEQVQQWDAGHAAIHAATGTDCTLCIPITSTDK